ncbi:MAG: lipid A deacylase LpxR family protein [Syntrophales bacterium]|nr:lipid A deacylase LpxR family protein [Syntrophales bacterium]MCK9527918.1 lipid A deacylase LpxR family protein [Syntrophales bacterium]MDX9921906.1 lipid A deacylase LpxR family protein [Syntrophales bacterium]
MRDTVTLFRRMRQRTRMTPRPLLLFLLVMTVLSCHGVPAEADSRRDHRARTSDTVTLYLENDLFGFKNRDRYYTHGTKLSWISRDLDNYREVLNLPDWMLRLIDSLPYVNDPGDIRTVSLSLGQNIYTPEDKERGDLVRDDRPYAGVTYLGLGLQSKSTRRMDTLELNLGIVGRHSYAQDCQVVIHRRMGSVKPRGWEHQLRDEPVLNLYFERKRRYLERRFSDGWGFDVIPHLGVAVGNLLTGVNLGGQARFGWNLPIDFGTYLIRPGSDSSAPLDDGDPRFNEPMHRLGIHLFCAIDTKAVARNIFLDGSTFRDSHSVDKKYLVADFIAGIGVIAHRFKITYSYVFRTKEFTSQRDEHQFGAIALSFTF